MNRCFIGDCRDIMRELITQGVKVQTCVTSPPYWRQRDYGVDGQLGIEQTPEEYIAGMVEVFGLARELLTDDGTCWINIGDKWASGGNGGGGSFMEDRGEAWAHAKNATGWRSPPVGYKNKDLIGVPWMLAFALRAQGWYLRQCNIWAKTNCMPESVTDRSTAAHEYVFHLSKSADYYYDKDAARTPPAPSSETRLAQNTSAQRGSVRANGGNKTNGTMKSVSRRSNKQRGHSRRHAGFNERWDAMLVEEQRANGANLRSVWWIAPAQFRDAHYAVMPERLAEICIVSATRPGDIVLDPFFGSGTTGEVAQRLGRQWIGCEIQKDYEELQKQRTAQTGMPI